MEAERLSDPRLGAQTAEPADHGGSGSMTARRSRPQHATPAPLVAASPGPSKGDERTELTASILRYLRRFPNDFADLAPLAKDLGVDPLAMQLIVERLARRGLLTLPFIEPSTAGGSELTERGLAWLIRHEVGTPVDVPALLQPATAPTVHRGARLPRAEVYGPGR